MYIERDNDKSNVINSQQIYNKDLFENEPGYSKAMTSAFKELNYLVENKYTLSVDLIKKLHQIAIESVTLSDKDPKPGKFRDETGSIFFFLNKHMSVAFFKTILNNPKIIIGEQEVGKYVLTRDVMGFLGNKEKVTVMLDNPKENKSISFENLITLLLENFNNNIGNALGDKKLQLIGDLIHDLDTLHPFKDGNGRTFDFLVLNWLLISQGLTSCSVFNTWHLAGFTSEERIEVIKEGQLFFTDYILSCKGLSSLPFIPLTSKLNEIIENSKLASVKEDETINQLPRVILKYNDESDCSIFLEDNYMSEIDIQTIEPHDKDRAIFIFNCFDTEETDFINNIREIKLKSKFRIQEFHVYVYGEENIDLTKFEDIKDSIIIIHQFPLVKENERNSVCIPLVNKIEDLFFSEPIPTPISLIIHLILHSPYPTNFIFNPSTKNESMLIEKTSFTFSTLDVLIEIQKHTIDNCIKAEDLRKFITSRVSDFLKICLNFESVYIFDQNLKTISRGGENFDSYLNSIGIKNNFKSNLFEAFLKKEDIFVVN
jgi:hypothetical protein